MNIKIKHLKKYIKHKKYNNKIYTFNKIYNKLLIQKIK